MDRKIILSLLAIIILVLAAAILLPGGRPADTQPKLPWMIDIGSDGLPSVFGLTLGKTTLSEARLVLGKEGKLNLFRDAEGSIATEAYFQRVALSGLRADFVLALTVSDDQARAMFERGLRVSKLGSGSQKVELSQADRQLLSQTPISHLTYIPGTDLEPSLIQNHFGEPQEKLTEPEGIEHWLYPARGLDIGVNPEGKEVMQYLQPAQFSKIVEPLRAMSTQTN